jgi:predicted kinase
VVEELRRRLVQLIGSGHDVALDHGLWRRSDRDTYKRPIEAHGGAWRLLYFKADRDLLGAGAPAEAEGFEPSRELPPYTLSRRVPSTARPSLRRAV